MGFINHIKEEIQVVRERDPAIKHRVWKFCYIPAFMLSYSIG